MTRGHRVATRRRVRRHGLHGPGAGYREGMLLLILTYALATKGLDHPSRPSSLAESDVVVVGEVGAQRHEDGTWDVRVTKAFGDPPPEADDHIRIIGDNLGNIGGLTLTLLINPYIPTARPGPMEIVEDEPLASFLDRAEQHFHDPREPRPDTYFVGSLSAWKAAEPPYECPGAAIDLRGSTYLIAPANTPEVADRLKARIPTLDVQDGVFDWDETFLSSQGWGHPVLMGRIKHDNVLERAGLSCEDLLPFDALAPAVMRARSRSATPPDAHETGTRP